MSPTRQPDKRIYDRWGALLVALVVLISASSAIRGLISPQLSVANGVGGPLAIRMHALAAFAPAFAAAAAYASARRFGPTYVRLPVALGAMMIVAVVYSIAMYRLSLGDPHDAASHLGCGFDNAAGCHNLAYANWWLGGVVSIVALGGATFVGTVMFTIVRELRVSASAPVASRREEPR